MNRIGMAGLVLLAGMVSACGSETREERWVGTYMMGYCFAQEPDSLDYRGMQNESEMILTQFLGEDRAQWRTELDYEGDALHALLRYRLGEDGGLQDGAHFHLAATAEDESALHMVLITERMVHEGGGDFEMERHERDLGPVDRSEDDWTVAGDWENAVGGRDTTRIQLSPIVDNPGGYPRLEILDMRWEEQDADGEAIGWDASPLEEMQAQTEREGYEDQRICYLPTRYWTE
ncbi:hypothetical protein J2T60_000091 [Natronospira proteinivora]|uniref:Uncharacterized protein n=1 Tax=Natronospira proteinivora TaxID=1807133 RepID=A0ABT1G498_9GAMM|nr:hypothetical protein [Natronospira proteinivora]MCP1726126.1 hypothetical protein [Natronospira proteinivora]